ncbi:GTP-binding domain [Pseudomonas phage PspYZU05]|uniref:Putative guanylate kinase n=1 Tax=Pseudomonas phage PspYZU05 TaxID=1983556 RepID=A0A2U7N2H9_9CAUD|nr:GTP-binding domain [Pseudomonas phage PspYZU05]ASD52005.1 putative guanylate kinase [Pseudomonas phage PspYZU05]
MALTLALFDEYYTVAVVGGRDYNDFNRLIRVLDLLFSAIDKPIKIISGGANGADTLAKQYAELRGYEFEEYPANWDDLSAPCKIAYKNGKPYNKLAGLNRNKILRAYADLVIGFWDGVSPGTAEMLKESYKSQIQVHVERY